MFLGPSAIKLYKLNNFGCACVWVVSVGVCCMCVYARVRACGRLRATNLYRVIQFTITAI